MISKTTITAPKLKFCRTQKIVTIPEVVLLRGRSVSDVRGQYNKMKLKGR